MRWPWTPRRSSQRLVLGPCPGGHAFVLTDGPPGAQAPRLLRWGVLPQPRPIAAGEALALLDPADYQVLKVDTPHVPPEELKAAARWQIKDLVDAELDDLTLDVMHVGGDAPHAHRQLFVVAAGNAAIQALATGCKGIHDEVGIVDIWETAMRNLLAHQARADGLATRACAAVLIDDRQGLLVIGAGDELYYTRRIEADAGLLSRARGEAPAPSIDELPLGFEYQPGGAFDAPVGQESPLVVELQRSIDVWERSWPDLPLARLYVATAAHGLELAALIQRELGQRTVALDPFAGFAAERPAPEGDAVLAAAACIPLLGAALRTENRQL